MTHHYRGRQAIYLVVAPPEFIPRRPWDVLPSFVFGTLHSKNLSMAEAHQFARVFNKRAVQDRASGKWDGRWAVVSKHLKSVKHGRHPLAGKGGAL